MGFSFFFHGLGSNLITTVGSERPEDITFQGKWQKKSAMGRSVPKRWAQVDFTGCQRVSHRPGWVDTRGQRTSMRRGRCGRPWETGCPRSPCWPRIPTSSHACFHAPSWWTQSFGLTRLRCATPSSKTLSNWRTRFGPTVVEACLSPEILHRESARDGVRLDALLPGGGSRGGPHSDDGGHRQLHDTGIGTAGRPPSARRPDPVQRRCHPHVRRSSAPCHPGEPRDQTVSVVRGV